MPCCGEGPNLYPGDRLIASKDRWHLVKTPDKELMLLHGGSGGLDWVSGRCGRCDESPPSCLLTVRLLSRRKEKGYRDVSFGEQ